MTAMVRSLSIALLTLAVALAAGSDALGRSLQLRAPQAAANLPTAKGTDLSAAASLMLALGMKEGLTARINLKPAEKIRVSDLSRAALQSEPMDSEAFRNLGLLANDAGHTADARRLMRAASDLSRRNIGASMWLALDYARLDQIDRSLAMYDQGLRSNSQAQEIIIPAMAEALQDDRMASAVTRLLLRRPPWLYDFWTVAANHPGSNRNLSRIRLELVRQGVSVPRAADRELVHSFTATGQFAAAEQLVGYLGGMRADPGNAVRNAGFDKIPEFSPFDWQPRFDASLTTDLDPRTGTLRISVFGEGSGEAALQLVALPGTAWRLAATTRDWSPDQSNKVYFKVRCAEEGKSGETAPMFLRAKSMSVALQKPVANCTYHWLTIYAAPSDGASDAAVTLDSVSLDRS